MKTSCALLTILTVAVMGTPSAAQTTSESARVDQIAREAAQKFNEARLAGRTETNEQTRPTVPPPPPGVRVELTLDNAVERALDRNLDLAVERLSPQTYDFSLAALDATFHPNLVSTFGLRSQTSFTRSQTAGGDILSTDTLTGNNGVQQNLKWGGGSYAIGFNNNRQEQSDLFATRNPVLNSSLTAAFSQPLLRNFRTDAVRTQLKITKINQEMSETSLRATVVRTVANVRNAYWDLVFAIQAEEVAQNSLQLATKLVEDNRARVEVGTLAPLDVTQAEAEQATRRQAVAQARATHGTAELALKRLIVNGTEDPYWTANIEPVDRPTYTTETVDVASAGTTRTDLAHRSRAVQEADSVERRVDPKPERRAVARPRPDCLLRSRRDRRNAVRAASGISARRGAFADHSERIQRRIEPAHRRTRADVELPRQLQLSARHEPRRSGDRACASAAASDDRAGPAARTAGCD